MGHNIGASGIDDDDWDDEPMGGAAANHKPSFGSMAAQHSKRPTAAVAMDLEDDLDQFLAECGADNKL